MKQEPIETPHNGVVGIPALQGWEDVNEAGKLHGVSRWTVQRALAES